MSAATEFDLGPLTWVKGEIDLALQRAEEALGEYAASGDATKLKFCRTHVHQVHGALAIVGLDGVTRVTESIEALLLAMEEGRTSPETHGADVVREAFGALHEYLDALMLGEPNQPVRLLPVHKALAVARGAPVPHPSDLFFPDLGVRPPKRPGDTRPLDRDQLRAALKSERARFQKGLLRWLKKPEEAEAGRQAMRDAVAVIEALQATPGERSFWWVSLALLESLADPALATNLQARHLCSRIDMQMRRLIDGSVSVPERVVRDALYCIAQAPAELHGAIAEVQSAYDVASLLPAATATVSLPQDAALRRLREVLGTTEEGWNRYCSGHAPGLPVFIDGARQCAQLTAELGHTDLKRLGQGLGSIANWLSEDNARFNDSVAMEVATAILLLANAQENFRRIGTDFAQQVDLMVARLHGLIAGRAPGEEAVPLLDEMTRRAQERLLIGQVGREIQNNLAQIEQALDGFFRDPSKRQELAQVDAPLKQVAGALAMLGHLGAVASVKDCGASIQRFSQPDYEPAEADFEEVANKLSLLGFFVDSLQNGETDFEAFARRMQGDGGAENEAAAPTVEDQLAQQARETRALAEALRDAPEDRRLQEELVQNLQAIQKDADLVANHELGESAKAALAALQAGDVADAALTSIAPLSPDVPAPSAETLKLAEAPHEAIDAELLAIFLEEANEVLATIKEQESLLLANPSDLEAFTTVRRSTHTLKGSGRMVGLTDLGETAWELEQTYNLWLRQDQTPNAEMLRMVGEQHALFSEWVAHLASGDGLVPDSANLIALARRLRGAEAPADSAPQAGAVPEAQPQIAEDVAILALEPSAEVAAEVSVESEEAASGLETIVFAPVSEEEEAPETVEVLDLPEIPEEPLAIPVVEEIEAGAESLVESATEDTIELVDLPELIEEPLPEVPQEEIAEVPEELPAIDEGEFPTTLESLPIPESPEEDVPLADDTPGEAGSSPTLYDIFREEARGYLQTLVTSHAQLDADPSLPTAFEMTRAAHTLAGISATVGIMPLHHLALALEHALLRRDHAANPASIEGLETVRQAIITLDGMFAQLAEQREPEEQPQLVAALEDVFQVAPVEEAPSQASAEIIPLHAAGQAPATLPQAPAPAPASEVLVPELPVLKDEFDEQLLPIFLEEATDLLRDLNEQLRAWRSDMAGQSAPQAIARLLHTFKGSARMAGAMNLGELTHLLETRVQDALHAGSATAGFIDEIESGCDTLSQAVERLRSGPPAADEPPLALQPPAPAAVAPTVAEAAVAQPVPPVARPVVAETEHEADAAAQARATLRVRADLVDRLVNEAGELSIARARIEGEMRSLKTSLLDLTENVIRLRRQLRDIEIQAESQIQARVAQAGDGYTEFDPLELDRFTRFQELTRFMAESVNDVATVQQNLLKNLDDANAAILAQARLNRSLQQELMSVRMVPFASQAERLYRIVRQTAKDAGKRATLDIIGGQVDIDRSVLDKMLPPIEHMLRNAVAHGIEDRETRLAAAKQEAGEIVLKLAQEGNEFILSMQDDGRGLDAARIRARAEEMGLLTPGQTVDDQALYEFIFHPGFSTASELTQLAGRGVGMDVVRTEVAALGGRIEIDTQPGEGTTFRLYLPLTLAVTQTLLVRVGPQLYALPSTMIEQVMELKEKAMVGLRERGEVLWQGNRYPLHFLPQLLGDQEAAPEAHRHFWVLLLRSGSQRVAVLVDELKGNQEVVVKNIGAQLARVVGIAGATVLGDGRVVLILNPVALASRVSAAASMAAPAVPAPQAIAESHIPTVMVVDDSLTVRKITSRLLTREGYNVILAKDGVDALEQLIEEQPDVILSDIEMPRMDGFDFVRNLRADDRWGAVPVIMITSRTADKHRNYALEIGANHYLGKPYDEEELLQLVAGYCKQDS